MESSKSGLMVWQAADVFGQGVYVYRKLHADPAQLHDVGGDLVRGCGRAWRGVGGQSAFGGACCRRDGWPVPAIDGH